MRLSKVVSKLLSGPASSVITTMDVVPVIVSATFKCKVAVEAAGALSILSVGIRVGSSVVAVSRTLCFSPPPGEMLFNKIAWLSVLVMNWSGIVPRVGRWLLGETSQPISSMLAKSSFVNSFRSPTVRSGSIAVSWYALVSINWLSIPSSQCALSSYKGIGSPYSATDAGPANRPDGLIKFTHESEIPIPSTCANSCTATEYRSFVPGSGGVIFECQLALDAKVTTPPHGAKSVVCEATLFIPV